MSMRITLENPDCLPEKKHRWDAGWDLRSNLEDFTLERFNKVKVYTGVKAQIPVRHMGIIVPRSGLGTKQEITLANDIGIIDSEYRGELIVTLKNEGEEDFEIKRYDRIAQFIILPIYITELQVVSNLGVTKRGEKGFGASGVK